jgi:hypothetical protein
VRIGVEVGVEIIGVKVAVRVKFGVEIELMVGGGVEIDLVVEVGVGNQIRFEVEFQVTLAGVGVGVIFEVGSRL